MRKRIRENKQQRLSECLCVDETIEGKRKAAKRQDSSRKGTTIKTEKIHKKKAAGVLLSLTRRK